MMYAEGTSKNSVRGSAVSVQNRSNSLYDIRNFFQKIEESDINDDIIDGEATVLPSANI